MINYEQSINEMYAKIADAKNYLNDTDYMALRQLDGGAPMPREVVKQRADARAIINQCEVDIARLEAKKKEQEEAQRAIMMSL